MKIVSIFEGMENAVSMSPYGANVKIIFRHSIRLPITDALKQADVKLMWEGELLAHSFGRYLEGKIGFVASSSSPRCIQTAQCILDGKKDKQEICIAKKELECPQNENGYLAGKTFSTLKNKEIIFRLANNIDVQGLFSLEHSVKTIVDYLFSTGNKANTIDLYCTHDFQMALLYAQFFDFAKTQESIEKNKWPMMFEGMVLWGTRKNFFVSWRGETKNIVDFCV